jgi:hypothetical protein
MHTHKQREHAAKAAGRIDRHIERGLTDPEWAPFALRLIGDEIDTIKAALK